jgi:hypothetical protein
MSCDFGIWFPHKRLSNTDAGGLYQRLCAGDTSEAQPHPAVDAFYTALTARHPELDTIPEARVGDHDYCPWSCALDRSAGHVILPCVWARLITSRTSCTNWRDSMVWPSTIRSRSASRTPTTHTLHRRDHARGGAF